MEMGVFPIINFIKEFNCDASVSIGDVVYISNIQNNYVYTNINNRENLMTIGIVISKSSSILASVQLYGECLLTFSGLESGKRVWLSPLGGLTTVLPTNGYVHIIGMCYENDKVFINPELNKLKRNPF